MIFKHSNADILFTRSRLTSSKIAHELYEWILDDELIMDYRKQKVIFRIARKYDELKEVNYE